MASSVVDGSLSCPCVEEPAVFILEKYATLGVHSLLILPAPHNRERWRTEMSPYVWVQRGRKRVIWSDAQRSTETSNNQATPRGRPWHSVSPVRACWRNGMALNQAH